MRTTVAVLVGVAVAACGGSASAPKQTGSIRTVVQALGMADMIEVTVTPGDVKKQLTLQQSQNGQPSNTFTGTMVVPLGHITVTATAYNYPLPDPGNPAATLIAIGSASTELDVSPLATAHVSLTILDSRPPTSPSYVGNHAPVITSFVSPATTVEIGHDISVSITAVDPIENSPLTYSWTVNPPDGCGSFADPHSASTIWTAPLESKVCTVTGMVQDDGKRPDGGQDICPGPNGSVPCGKSDTRSVEVAVTSPGATGVLDATAIYIPRPSITGIQVNGYDVMNGWTNVHVTRGQYQGVIVSHDASPAASELTWTFIDDCGGIPGSNYNYTTWAQSFSWQAPGHAAVCVLTFTAERRGLTSAPAQVLVIVD